MKLMSRRGSIAPVVCFILLMLSIGLNILLIRARQPMHQGEPTQAAVNGQQDAYLREIAATIGLNIGHNRSAGDMASDIHIALSEADVDVLRPIHPDVIKNIEEALGPKDAASIRRLNEFVKSLQGKRLLALPGKR